MFFKVFTKGHYPIPGDLLVSFYFPWYSGGWEGYDPWTTHKELIGADSIRQIYPWKEFAMDQFKKLQFPLWNPYTFSGQPLAANFQSSVYYPLNVFYFLTDAKNAWILIIVSQPFLAGIFMYLAVRSFKITQAPALFASVSFMFSSYFITWLENGNISHSYLLLPLVFWSINKYFDGLKIRYYLILTLSISMSIFAGHPQTLIYILLAAAVFWIFKTFNLKKNRLRKSAIFISSLIISLLIAAIQLVPTIDFYLKSPISLPSTTYNFEEFILPYQNLVTFLAPDFFGHPATNNFWSRNYGDFTPYFGVLPLILSIWSVIKLWDNKFVKFTALTAVFFIISTVPGPIIWLIKTLQIPLLDSTSAGRSISVSIFLLIILAAFGIQDLLSNIKKIRYLKKFVKFLAVVGIVYTLLWLFAILAPKFNPQEIWQVNFSVTRRNLILPTTMVATFLFGIISLLFLKKVKIISEKWSIRILIAGIFAITLLGSVFYSNKFLPVSPKKFIFPEHPLFSFIKENNGINRFYGGGTARVDYNMPTHYRIYVSEGYDTLRLRRYAELIAASRNNGIIPSTYLRSDAVFPDEENSYRKRLFDLLGVTYLLDKEDTPKTGADWNVNKFPDDDVQGFWQEGKFLVYLRNEPLPRVFMTSSYTVAQSDNEIIEKVFDKNFDFKTIVLEEQPPIKIQKLEENIVEPKIIKYEPNQATFSINKKNNSLLFLSDAYDTDWQAYIDGKNSKILRADYALRAVAVPAGDHTVDFKYQPKSFVIGMVVSTLGILTLIMLSIFFVRRKQF
ncbi:MAG: hypothetical protein A3B38_00010 [Candidatus Levybacteria bacterium RIFCSPLOWO2_01_FULL_36_13]|nr:MAG: hypothetical protein A3B38_00010 [Candidatus Levybacteria bacterium RIFCSPLOWO2_01_FULL_36_13]